MGNLLSNLLAMSIAGSVVAGLMLLLRPVTARIFPAKWQYAIGKMAIAFYLLPAFLFAVKLPSVQPIAESYPAEPSIVQEALPALPPLTPNVFVDAADTLMEKHLTFELIKSVLLIWFVGAIVFAGWHLYCYRRFSKQLRTDSFPVPADTAAALLSSCKAEMGIHDEVKLMQNRKITSPMLVGLLHPMILLPASSIPGIDLKLVLTHELMHLKRKDLWVKMFALLASTLHWFNPLAHVLRKDVSIWGELSCDEALVAEMSHEERKLYGEAILNTLDNYSGMNTAFCSSLCESKKHIERRLTMLLNAKKMKKHIAVLAVAAIVAIAGVGTTASALAAKNAPKLDANLLSISSQGVNLSPTNAIVATEGNARLQVKRIGTNLPAAGSQRNEVSEGAKHIPSAATVSINSMDGLKKIELKGDGKEYTFEEFKQWLDAARLEAAELVKSGVWTQEQADRRLALYENTLADIEQKGGRTFGKMIDKGDEIFPERIDVFYTVDELVFELPAKLAGSTSGPAEIGYVMSVHPKR